MACANGVCALDVMSRNNASPLSGNPAQSESKIVPINAIHSVVLHGTRSGTMALKKCVFGCEGKITLFGLPKNQELHKQWKQFVFPGQQRSFSSVFVDESCIVNAQFDTGFAHRLILKDGEVPAIKDPGHDSELQIGK